MSISVNPILPVIAAQGAAPDLVLQPGSVVDAEVLKILSDNLVRIAIASLSIDVLSEIPLVVGQTLQLAVSQTQDGIRLAVVGQGAASAASADTVTLAPNASIDAVAGPPLSAALPRNILTPLEQVAVAAAAQSAATQQDSLAPLFANLGVVAGSNSLPPKLQQAVMQVLAQQTSLDRNLTGSDVGNAVQKSGLFLEASLASGSVLPAAGMPDLKAALIVLRQALVSSLAAAGETQGAATPATATPTPATAAPATAASQPAVPALAVISAGDSAAPEQAGAATTLVPSLSPDVEAQEMLLPQARVPVVADYLGSNALVRIVLPEALLNAGPRTMTAAAALNLLQETMPPIPRITGNASLPAAAPEIGPSDDVTFHTQTPPPPFRRNRWPRLRSPLARRSPLRRIICSGIPTPRSRARPCCRWPHCRIVPIPRPPGLIRRRRAGVLKFRSRCRREPRWHSSKSRATAAAARLNPQSGFGGRDSRSTSNPRVRFTRWCR